MNRRKQAYLYGMAAERWARMYLQFKGYRILSKRHLNAQGEIDILASKGDTLIAIEVKARRSFADCEESVPPWKQQKIMRAMEWLQASGKFAGLAKGGNPNIRFDTIWIVAGKWPRHIKNAWGL